MAAPFKFVSKELAQSVASRRCVVYVGAGFSMPCGMPGWAGLLSCLVAVAEDAVSPSARRRGAASMLAGCRYAIRAMQFPLAAEIVRRILPPATIDEVLHKQFDVARLDECNSTIKKRMHARQANLVTAPWAGIITTNYDELIESGWQRIHKSSPLIVGGDDRALGSLMLRSANSKRPFLVKLHGTSGASWKVLSSQEYDNAYVNRGAITSFLNAVMQSFSVIFIGCSLGDEVLRIRQKMVYDFDRHIAPAYALLPVSALNRAREYILWENYLIRTILYDANNPKGFGSHSAVDCALEELASIPK